jgi:hypothetical protein
MVSIKLPRLGLPSFGYGLGVLPKKQFIKGIDNYTLVGGVAVAALAALYYAQKQGLITLPGLGGVLTPAQVDTADEGGTPTGHKIAFTISPLTQVENGTIIVSGNILDSNGAAYNAPNLYYYLYQELPGGLVKLVNSGNVGNNVSSYRKVISLAGLRPGDYKVRVSEELLPSSGAVLSGSTDIAGQAPPYTDNTITGGAGGNVTVT